MKSLFYALLIVCSLVIVTGQMACKSADAQVSAQASVVADDCTSPNCPLCGSLSSWTGRTQVIDAQIWNVMKCVRGHEFLSKNP